MSRQHVLPILLAAMIGLLPHVSQADAGWLPLSKHLVATEDISALAVVHGKLWLAADEADAKGRNLIQQFSFKGEHLKTLNLIQGDELDTEAMAVEGHTLYAIGSHSAKRKKLKNGKSYARNRRMLQADEVRPEENRAQLFRLQLNDRGQAVDVASLSLRSWLRRNPVLAPFTQLASKENGVDIEGLGVRHETLYAGFRGPVLRGGMTPVLRFRMDDLEHSARLLWVRLHGLGIRGITEVTDGFLLLAGPVNDLAGPYAIYHWDGEDMTPGNQRHNMAFGHSHLLKQWSGTADSKPEAIALLAETTDTYQLLLAFDGAQSPDRAVRRIEVRKP